MGSTRRRAEISRLIRTKAFKRGYFLVRLFNGWKRKEHYVICKKWNIRQHQSFSLFSKVTSYERQDFKLIQETKHTSWGRDRNACSWVLDVLGKMGLKKVGLSSAWSQWGRNLGLTTSPATKTGRDGRPESGILPEGNFYTCTAYWLHSYYIINII